VEPAQTLEIDRVLVDPHALHDSGLSGRPQAEEQRLVQIREAIVGPLFEFGRVSAK
jgi:hypothetical protein